ncbi:MAG: methyltransferase domain-containing protein [Pseudomonadota bacterium]
MATTTLYVPAFYANRDANTVSAARKVLGIVFSMHQINSVCDVGCGVGTWLKVAGELGAETVFGYEGDWVDRNALVIPDDRVKVADLSVPLVTEARYDLAISLEVAEHLPPDRAGSFVSDLCGLSDRVLFSAAIPHQGGTGHVNERWQSYWAGLFAQHGHRPVDAVRPLVWTDTTVPWWYRQNAILYVRGAPGAEAQVQQLDLVHPEQFLELENATLSRAAKKVWPALKRRLRKGLKPSRES